MIHEAGGELPEDPGAMFDLLKQQTAAIRADGSTVKSSDDLTPD